jgi:hypothetical protein
MKEYNEVINIINYIIYSSAQTNYGKFSSILTNINTQLQQIIYHTFTSFLLPEISRQYFEKAV